MTGAAKVGDRVDYQGGRRQVTGRLHYPTPPVPGTLVGPNGWGEVCVVLGTVAGLTLLGLAIRDDFAAAFVATAVAGGVDPRSLFERRPAVPGRRV